MRKFFIAICFSLLVVYPSVAKITALSSYRGSLQPSRPNTIGSTKVVDYDEFASFITNAIKNAKVASKQDLDSKTTSVISSVDKEQSVEDQKSIFDKIYDQAMQKAMTNKNVFRSDIIISQPQDVTTQKGQWQNQDIPTTKVRMPPSYNWVDVPAVEHIPYCMTNIDVLNNNLVKITETVMIVANGDKLKQGLTKILPSKVSNTKGGEQTLDYSLISVLRNDQPIDYHLSSLYGNVLLIPEDDETLAPGVYTYIFEYLVDNLLIDNGDSYMMYWDVGGHGWNLVVDRLGATLILPEKQGLLQQQVLFGTEDNLYSDEVTITPFGATGAAYIARRPLFIGEGMYVMAMIDKKVILPLTLWQKFMHFFYDYGDIILAAFGCILISLSLLISWKYIKAERKIKKFSLPKTAMILRYLQSNKFDMVSACGFLLDLYHKKLIDLQKTNNEIILIKRSDNFNKLARFERQALSFLFPQQQTSFKINKINYLVFERFVRELRSGFKRVMTKFIFKINFMYFAASFLMLLLTEAFISWFKIASGLTFGVLVLSSIITALCLFAWCISPSRWFKYCLRICSILVIGSVIFIMSMFVNVWTAAVLITAEIIIFIAAYFYSRRYGTIRYYIHDVNNYREHLFKNRDNIVLGNNFLNYQSAVWALDLSDSIKPSREDEYYKIPLMKEIIAIMR